MIVFTQTDFPEPVAPAISRCGIFARSATTGRPSRSSPNAIGSEARAVWYSRVSISLRNQTSSAVGLGTSTPTAPRPGIGATMRILCARIARARSLARFANCLTFTPDDGSISNCVTTGPVVRFISVPSTRNVRSASISFWPISSSSRDPWSPAADGPSVSRSGGGSSSSSLAVPVSFGAKSVSGVAPAAFRARRRSAGVGVGSTISSGGPSTAGISCGGGSSCCASVGLSGRLDGVRPGDGPTIARIGFQRSVHAISADSSSATTNHAPALPKNCTR